VQNCTAEKNSRKLLCNPNGVFVGLVCDMPEESLRKIAAGPVGVWFAAPAASLFLYYSIFFYKKQARGFHSGSCVAAATRLPQRGWCNAGLAYGAVTVRGPVRGVGYFGCERDRGICCSCEQKICIWGFGGENGPAACVSGPAKLHRFKAPKSQAQKQRLRLWTPQAATSFWRAGYFTPTG